MIHETDQARISRLVEATGQEDMSTAAPPQALLSYLSQITLSDSEFRVLFGESPGFTVADVHTNALKFWYSLRNRVANLLCENKKLKHDAEEALGGGATALFPLLLGWMGISAGSAASAALVPIAVWLAKAGLRRLCGGAS